MLGRVFEAASIILLRPARQTASVTKLHVYDYEILMVGRPLTAEAFAERIVFPGGKVEKSDSELKRSDMNFLRSFSTRYQVCAIRELFEETGVLLTDPPMNLTNDEELHWRRRVLTDANSFNDLMDAFKCNASVSKLKPWSHWITPATEKRRFDTWYVDSCSEETQQQNCGRFFVAETSADSKASVFAGEMELVDISWRSPGLTLEAYKKRLLQLAPPQIYILEQLSHRLSMESIFQNLPHPCTIKEYLPIIQKMDKDAFTILLPGDKNYTNTPSDGNRLHRVEIHSDPSKTKVYGASTT